MDDDAHYRLYRKQKLRFTKNLRRTMTEAEAVLWRRLRNRNFQNLKFRRQVNIGPYIADFLCKEHKLIVEVDGKVHDHRKEYDASRDAYLQEHGYFVLRVQNTDVFSSMPRVLQNIANFISSHSEAPLSSQEERGRG